jgi:hypothetical protein
MKRSGPQISVPSGGGDTVGLTSSVSVERGSHDYVSSATSIAVPYPVSLVSKPIDKPG